MFKSKVSLEARGSSLLSVKAWRRRDGKTIGVNIRTDGRSKPKERHTHVTSLFSSPFLSPYLSLSLRVHVFVIVGLKHTRMILWLDERTRARDVVFGAIIGNRPDFVTSNLMTRVRRLRRLYRKSYYSLPFCLFSGIPFHTVLRNRNLPTPGSLHSLHDHYNYHGS